MGAGGWYQIDSLAANPSQATHGISGLMVDVACGNKSAAGAELTYCESTFET
jgi:hypothetical protein